ncbi:unnamed protein product [Allacma fusca]|uniref:Uncharacterized protein n=1 Tax=Allacma fusca TaxID=39272 RepID=A0A8J2LZL4_9HEXA|nr:unnamed protein product [Allacma fusca]
MPHVFRSYSDEETPKILERRTTDESSDSDSDEEERFIRELLENEAKLTQTTDSLTELPTIEAATVTETEEEKVQELDKPIQKKQTTEPVLKLTSAFSPKRNSPADSGTSGGASSGYTSGDETYNVEKKDEVRKPTPKFVSFGTQTPAEENLRSPASVSGLLRKSYHSRPKKAALKRKRNRTSHKLDPDANQTKAHDTFLKTRQDKTELSPTKRAGQISQLNIKANPMPLFPKVGQQPRLSPSTMTRKLATENIPVQKVTPGIKPAAKGRISSPATPAQFLTILPKGHPNSVRPQLSGTSYPRIPGTNATKTQLGKSQGRKLTPPGPSVGPTRLRPNPKTGWGKGSPRKSKRETEAGSGTTGSSDSPKPKSASSPNDILSNPNKKSQP